MGNCLGTCFGSIRRKSKVNYFGGRYKEYNVGIEFESLIEDDLVQQSERAAITDSERDHLLNKRYSDLVKDQKRRDAEIDSELKKQEENIRLEEEAYIAAKRESARAALQTRAREPRRSRPVANGTAKSSWLGDNESEWNVAGADEDDFETFLESVKARSQSVRANGLAHNPYGSIGYATTGFSHPETSDSSPKSREASNEPTESDSDFEPEFVSAETVQVQVPTKDAPNPAEAEQLPHNSRTNVAPQSNLDRVVVEMHNEEKIPGAGRIEETPMDSRNFTQSTAVQSGKESGLDRNPTNQVLDEPNESRTNSAETVQATKPTFKSSATEDDPFDFDRFLEELDLE
ncbi:AP-1 complex-associated regulatory protein-like isoform X2 [Acanthaster planci]|uniref:AP-1 complex-associated regulatory protein-like isoform X2 n=1 Tax=Acanthaster planci TaxID=133434 RepID=A0A8B7XED9_ACAPL|nr:AP-1 complex-associated regulatory protein-like isoform X2 [Acanthaster planci]